MSNDLKIGRVYPAAGSLVGLGDSNRLLSGTQPQFNLAEYAGLGAMRPPLGSQPSHTDLLKAHAALLKILHAIQIYMPPDGPSAKETLNSIIGIVDPWPLGSKP